MARKRTKMKETGNKTDVLKMWSNAVKSVLEGRIRETGIGFEPRE